MADLLVLTSLIFSPLQAVKKQNIVYLGRCSVTNTLPVLKLWQPIQITNFPLTVNDFERIRQTKLRSVRFID